MAETVEFPPGAFCWVDLATTDPEAAKRFYGELFGWEAEDLAVGEGTTYTMWRLRGAAVAAVSAQMDDERGAGIPPHWSSYVSVESADEAAARARSLGAHVHMDPFDVMDAGRMSIVTDPQGAVFVLWEGRRHKGAEVINEPGSLVWNHLLTHDPPAAAEFYSSLLGWSTEPAGDGSTLVRAGELLYGGIGELPPGEGGEMPPNWAVFFTVEDIAAACERVGALGGAVLQPPSRIGWGTIAVVADPQGAAFGIFEGTAAE